MVCVGPSSVLQKVVRSALPDPGNERPLLDAPFTPPRTDLEKELVRIWSEVLGIERVGINDPFLELGGDSLRATQIVSRVLDEFHVEIPLETLMKASTVTQMAAVVNQQLENKVDHIPITPSSNRNGPHPLSFAQERMWFLAHLEHISSAYHTTYAYKLKGVLNKNALNKALQLIVSRHKALRTTFCNTDEGPTQTIS